MAEANNVQYPRDLAPGYYPLHLANMGQTHTSQSYNDQDFFLSRPPGDRQANQASEWQWQSLQPRSPTSDVFNFAQNRFNSRRSERPLFEFTPSPPPLQGNVGNVSHSDNHETDVFAFEGSSSAWDTPNHQLSPLRGSQANRTPDCENSLFLPPSPPSRGQSPIDIQSQRSRPQRLEGYVDLTTDPSSPTMPAAPSRVSPSRSQKSREASSSTGHPPSKRRKTQAVADTASSTVKDEPDKIEAVDLRDVDDDIGLSRVLEQQRAETIKLQQKEGDQPIKVSSLQCIICMEPMTNITVTHCGRSTCTPMILQEALSSRRSMVVP